MLGILVFANHPRTGGEQGAGVLHVSNASSGKVGSPRGLPTMQYGAGSPLSRRDCA
jgi:hypothetical protein